MYLQANKQQENTRHSSQDGFSTLRNENTSALRFMNNRSEAISQLQQVSQSGQQVQQLMAYQSMADAYTTQRQEKPNNTGLPDQLKTGIESLSGMSMDHVKVHYNSDKPAQLNAHAYAQGSEIHVARGQEKHVPHEAWHVVQQAQGRVKPTMQLKAGIPVNDDAGLEREADVMGAKALNTGNSLIIKGSDTVAMNSSATGASPIQRSVNVKNATYDLPKSIATELKIAGVPKVAFGVATKATALYYRPLTIEANIIPGKIAADKQGNANTDCTTPEIGGIGFLESMAFNYGPNGDYDFAGGHLVGSQFWTTADNSLTEENMVPMRQKVNSSLYKILESEVASYIGTEVKMVKLRIKCSYNGTQQIKLANATPLLAHLDSQGIDIHDDSKLDKTQDISVEPRVPYKIEVVLSTFVGNNDLPQKDMNTPGPTDIYRAKTYDKPDYVDGVGWDASSSEQLSTVSSSNWQDFDPVRLKKAGVRTYNFYQQARP